MISRSPARSAASDRRRLVGVRLAVAAAAGVLVAGVVAIGFHGGTIAPTAGWVVFALVFLIRTWRVIGGMDGSATAAHATREDPTARWTGLILTAASLVSVGGVVALLVDTHRGGSLLAGLLAVTSVALSWVLVHTLYTLDYAALFYADPKGGVDFNQQADPDYADFAYLAFTLGMTYQVSDTSITSRTLRHAALRHSLLSYLLGAIVLASTVNLIAGLGPLAR